ncbi:MAG: ATP-dependent helicase [Chloroflexi bacterium]|nr:ATP-dependent helicase [Chloroflexota bacterium]
MEELDPSQRAFCEAPIGDVRLLAPAGCGKTLCLLYRCIHLARQGRPRRSRFLIVTFTVAAKQELLTRLHDDSQFAEIREAIEITTLNSWGFRRIKNATISPKLITSKADYHFAMLNQLQPIWQKHESLKRSIQSANRWKKSNAPQKLLKVMDAFKSLGFDHIRHSNFKQFERHVEELHKQGLSWKLKEQLEALASLDVLDVSVDESGQEVLRNGNSTTFEQFFKFWLEGVSHLMSNATFTLEDQKYFAFIDARENIEQGQLLSGAASYDHVFVDEFQDINPLDLALIKAIVERNRATLTIAGDDDQAIFEWRGASPEYILEPEDYFKSRFETFTLSVNYRSPHNIVEKSQQLIANNMRRVPKQISASSSKDAQIDIKRTDGPIASLQYVSNMIEESITQSKSPSRIAIIGRKRAQIIPYQVHFASKEIAFCAAEDLQVFLGNAFDKLLDLLLIKTRSRVRQRKSQVVNDLIELCDLVKRYPLNKKDKQSLRKFLQQCNLRDVFSASDTLANY